MLITKWLIADTINEYNRGKGQAGVCLYMPAEPSDISNLYKSIQSLSAGISFTLLLSGKDFDEDSGYDSYIMKLLGLFFLPSYYYVNYQPLVFVQNKSQAVTNFLDKLNKKCRKQGIRNILFSEINDSNPGAHEKFTFILNDGGFDLNMEIKKWINENIKGSYPSGMHVLVPAGKEEIMDNVLEIEKRIKETEEYKIADVFYQKQQLIEESNHQLYLKAINEKNIRFYLNIQKEERAKGLKWYYYEYEILPVWYKQFGHIIKVIMGKRSFRSLFNDNVKKYKG